jgi:hypothetical protein
MTDAELGVMLVLLEAPLDPEEAIRVIAGGLRGDPLEQPTAAYEAALRGCMDKGWVTTITAAELELRIAELSREMIPAVHEGITGGEGQLDLSAAGYRKLGTTARFRRQGMISDSRSMRLHVYSDSIADCVEHAISYIRSSTSYPFDDGTGEMPGAGGTIYGRFVSASGPESVAPWRLNRFDVVPGGFRITLQYRPAPVKGDG